MECTIINPALLLLMKYLVIGQRQKAPNFSVFHWSPLGGLISRVVHLPKRTETSLITESGRITESDQAVRSVHSCNSWLLPLIVKPLAYISNFGGISSPNIHFAFINGRICLSPS